MTAHEFDCLCRDCLKRDADDPRPSVMRTVALAEAMQEAHADLERLRAWLFTITREAVASRSRDSAAAALRGEPAPDAPPVPVPPREGCTVAHLRGPCPRSELPIEAPPSMPPLHHGASYNE